MKFVPENFTIFRNRQTATCLSGRHRLAKNLYDATASTGSRKTRGVFGTALLFV
jgi:hypothetical protein